MASLQPELIAQIGGFPITNTLIATLIVDVLLILLVFFVARNIKQRPKRLQNIVEMIVIYFYDMTKSMAGKRAKAILPWVMTFFLFIVVSNFLGLMPGIGSIGFVPESSKSHDAKVEKNSDEHLKLEKSSKTENIKSDEIHKESSEHESEHLISLVRPLTSDFNATLALAVISLVATHVLSIKYTGLTDYLSRYFVINPIMLFVGLLELVSEFIKIFSLSFRLFGNIYAGEVVMATISGLFAFVAPLPFLLLESIVAIVQALVFSMLTLVFMSMLTEKHHAEH